MGTAMVFVDRPPTLLAADAVMADNVEGAMSAVRHLVSRGHRRIAFLGDLTSIATAQDRYTGYLEVMREAGLPADAAMVRHDLHTAEAAEAAVTALLAGADPPTALFSSQNLITMGAVRALRACGNQRRTALVGFDDLPLADMLDPPVSVVAQDVLAIATLAAQILFGRIDGDTAPPQTHIVPTRLIPRGSGEIPPP
jgi:LacI family transcriptional regulator